MRPWRNDRDHQWALVATSAIGNGGPVDLLVLVARDTPNAITLDILADAAEGTPVRIM
jgi:hypothetical protein